MSCKDASFLGMNSAYGRLDRNAMNDYQGKRVLIVDDDEGIVVSVARILKRNGMEAECYTSPLKVVEVLGREGSRRRYDLFIVDIQMPDMKGTELISKHIMARDADATVLPITGILDDDLRSSLAGMGCGRVLEKPFAKEELMAMVAKMLVKES